MTTPSTKLSTRKIAGLCAPIAMGVLLLLLALEVSNLWFGLALAISGLALISALAVALVLDRRRLANRSNLEGGWCPKTVLVR